MERLSTRDYQREIINERLSTRDYRREIIDERLSTRDYRREIIDERLSTRDYRREIIDERLSTDSMLSSDRYDKVGAIYYNVMSSRTNCIYSNAVCKYVLFYRRDHFIHITSSQNSSC